MNSIDVIILGIVEGVTEFLPISSTAHLQITQQILHIQTTDFIKSFNIAIQLGAICAVIVLYIRKIFSSHGYFLNICIAFIPTAVIGFVLYNVIKFFLLGNIILSAVMLIVGGLVIVLYESKQKGNIEPTSSKTIGALSIKELLVLGCIQALAVIPGVSRSGAIIIGGRMLGFPRTLITEFSFLLAIPTMMAAVGYDLLKSGVGFTGDEWGTVVFGFFISFITALVVVKWLIRYIQTHSFMVFGWYRILIGVIILLIFLK